ncbi:hypothetical protein [Arthrobacter sp. M4]|uniref:AMIN-like domain-containing (lipo)protein n=1 Tax=Arthrobacter sp. M4 TaxID=218160 RepID=UPI001CDCAE24|nr:hypothetical protein [Arthrobacter sp. M4]MCA4134797.1 hypothetical protein [Arthrobacter sp. M4]
MNRHKFVTAAAATTALSAAIALIACSPPAPQPSPSSSSSSPSSSATPTKPTTSPTPSAASSSPTATPTPTQTPQPITPWSTADFSSPAAITAGSAKLTQLRVGAHPDEGFDRIAFLFEGMAPGVTVHYVAQVVGGASGKPISLTGGANLQIVFHPAAAHNDAGQPTITVPAGVQVTGYPGIQSYVLNDDFEAVLSVAIGQATKSGFRVGQYYQNGFCTVYVDVPRP